MVLVHPLELQRRDAADRLVQLCDVRRVEVRFEFSGYAVQVDAVLAPVQV